MWALNGEELRVFADDKLLWEGSVGAEAVSFDGPVGIRSDNARFEIELRAGETLEARREQVPG